MTHSLEWPSLTCQWLPNINITDPACAATAPQASSSSGNSTSNSNSASASASPTSTHSLLIGTHTTPGEQNYLMVANVELPNSDYNSQQIATTSGAAKYDDERGEVGGFFTENGNVDGKIEIKLKVKHDGEVNRARYMPQNHFVVASKGPSPEVYVFDLSKHPSFPDADSAPAPQHILRGHTSEGYGLAWDPHTHSSNKKLLSGSEDCKVCLWDLAEASTVVLNALCSFEGHTDVVEDVAWHTRDPNMIGSVGDDRAIFLWDVREHQEPAHKIVNAHAGDINGIAFNPVNEFLFATSSADKTVALWDARNLKTRMHTLQGHTDQVFQVEWAPFNETILGSCSADRRVNIWDLSRIGQEQSVEDAEDGPPELLFVHGGHTSKVSDFCWNRNDEWTIASVSEDNILQIWNMAEEIYAGDDDDDNDDDELDEGELE
mmetsp:Transcript_9618/g.14319  ORF Transcript_9618/g.14319 Transcript_9618/m.14319 type:complete len:433 (+) Transcript_9618:363-1661(+)|eukprot:CAMPEP_0196802090 /NCGR_PEP_ID=MMETSP1362-20130617/1789_1 /TAXON_ID=163516 /ORGANISM="Leptocylindrus danicus, Strain CCMP1856" /LENGTH=432 /DNA_ID=CAMNT_0042173299 /DNA_START=332 /DNA_END=1630 /DNA_ORIENTATION=-